MPVYAYEPTYLSEVEPERECCHFETLQGLSDAPLSTCPTCGASVHRVFSLFAVGANRFQGTERGVGAAPLGEAQSGSTAAKRAVRNAMRHICRAGCRH